MGKIVHFEIPASDVERAKKFYEGTFGWHMNPMPEMNYTIVHTGPTDDQNGMPKETGFINGGIMAKNAVVTAPSMAIDVEDIDVATEKVKAAGGEILKEKNCSGNHGLHCLL
jgi:predicted enzyme related to lactoylglutathione lyase